MKIDDAFNDLKLIETVYRKLIVTTNYKKISNSEISWDGYNSGVFKNIYAKEYETIIKNRQYSFLLKDDKGCIQFYYYYESDILSKVKMAYYPYPVILRENKDDFESMISDTEDELLMEYYYDIWNIFNHHFELNIKDDNLKKLVNESLAVGNSESSENLLMGKFEYKYAATNSSHFRIDFDSKVSTHHKCEVQIGAINNIRLPMSKLISPFVFFEFIIKNIFKEDADFVKIMNSSSYSTTFQNSKKKAIAMDPFIENNIFLNHE